MSYPPIPKRKGMVAVAAQWDQDEGRWRGVEYRPIDKRPKPEPAPEPEPEPKRKRGSIAVEQGSLFDS